MAIVGLLSTWGWVGRVEAAPPSVPPPPPSVSPAAEVGPQRAGDTTTGEVAQPTSATDDGADASVSKSVNATAAARSGREARARRRALRLGRLAGIDTSGRPAPEASDGEGETPWHVGGFVDTHYGFSSLWPRNHVYRGTATQPRIGEFSMNHVALYLRHDATPGRWDWTMEAAFQAGPATDALVAGEPRLGGENAAFAGAEVWKHVGRANAGFVSPRGTQVSAGLHYSPVGIGMHWTPYNWNVTTSWELNSVPYYLVGLRVQQPLDRRGRHALQAWVVNGWQHAGERNDAPSAMLGYLFTPTADLSFAQFLWMGPEGDRLDPRYARIFSDTQVVWNREAFGFGALFDFGGDGRGPSARGEYDTWLTTAIFTRWRVLTRPHLHWDMAARPEVFWDRAGVMYGVPRQALASGTFTQQLTIARHVLVRIEYRYDHAIGGDGFFYANQATSPDATGLGRAQHLVFLNLAAVFDYAFGQSPRR